MRIAAFVIGLVLLPGWGSAAAQTTLRELRERAGLPADSRDGIALAKLWQVVEKLPDQMVVEAALALQQSEAFSASLSEERLLFDVLHARWREIDLEGALKHLDFSNEPRRERKPAADTLRLIAKTDYERARKLSRKMPDRDWAESVMIAALAEVDPVRAAGEIDRFLETNHSNGLESEPDWGVARVAKEVGRLWAKQDPETAMAWAGGLNHGLFRGQAVEGAALGTSAEDLKSVVAQVRKVLGGELPSHQIWSLGARWMAEDWDEAAEWAIELPAGEDRSSQLARLADARPDAAVALLKRAAPFWGGGRWKLTQEMLPRVHQLETLMNLLESMPPEKIKHRSKTIDYLLRLLRHGAPGQPPSQPPGPLGVSPARIVAFAQRFPKNLTGGVIPSVIARTASANPLEALAIAAALPAPDFKAEMTDLALRIWVMHDFGAALEWAIAQPGGVGGDMYRRLLAAVHIRFPGRVARELSAYFEKHPGAANEPFLAQFTGKTAEVLAADRATGRETMVLRKDPCERAAAWAASLPPGLGREAAFRSISRMWERRDANGWDAWIETLNGADLEAATGGAEK